MEHVTDVTTELSDSTLWIHEFLETYSLVLLQTQSLYTALFRYICIAKDTGLHKLHLTPKVQN